MGELDSARVEFETALQHDPEESLALFNAGLCSQLMGEKNRALDYFLAAEKAHPLFFEALLQIGKIYLERRDPATARPYFEKAAEIRTESGPACSGLGDCYTALGMPEDAEAAYKKALRLNANDAASLSGLGWIYANQGKDPDIGKLFCQHSVEIAPENGLYRHRLGEIYVKENRLQHALDAFTQAIALGYDSEEAVEKVKSLMTDAASKTG
jgi:tetratricopeptide (TPR) repeat protein